jgi:hypothetical protein
MAAAAFVICRNSDLEDFSCGKQPAFHQQVDLIVRKIKEFSKEEKIHTEPEKSQPQEGVGARRSYCQ